MPVAPTPLPAPSLPSSGGVEGGGFKVPPQDPPSASSRFNHPKAQGWLVALQKVVPAQQFSLPFSLPSRFPLHPSPPPPPRAWGWETWSQHPNP